MRPKYRDDDGDEAWRRFIRLRCHHGGGGGGYVKAVFFYRCQRKKASPRMIFFRSVFESNDRFERFGKPSANDADHDCPEAEVPRRAGLVRNGCLFFFELAPLWTCVCVSTLFTTPIDFRCGNVQDGYGVGEDVTLRDDDIRQNR